MAHWAQIDENNIVIQVLVTDNNDPNGDEGYQFLINAFGGTWVKTSYNTRENKHLEDGTPFRKNFAGIGFSYDEERDAFIPPKPYDSWVLNEETCVWYSPVEYPTDGLNYRWDEDLVNWELVETEEQ